MKNKRMLKSFIVSVILGLFSTAFYLFPDPAENIKYYRVDQVITVTGEITDIKTEKSYHKSDFIVVYLKEKKTGHLYKIEVSPDWFFDLDMASGQKIQVTGSHNKIDNVDLIMTRTLVCGGEVYQFRDESGFPLWRGKGRYLKGSGRKFKHKQKRGGSSGGKGRH
jgi:hypothetical protein